LRWLADGLGDRREGLLHFDARRTEDLRVVRPQGFPDGPRGTAISAGSSVRNIGAVDRARLFNREQAVADEVAAGTADSAVGDPAGCDRLRSLLGNG